MTGQQLEFLSLVEACEPSADWMPGAMKVSHLVPDELSAEDAAAAFVRWLYKEPPQERDSAMRKILTRGSAPGT
jgi:hypothetical protein